MLSAQLVQLMPVKFGLEVKPNDAAMAVDRLWGEPWPDRGF